MAATPGKVLGESDEGVYEGEIQHLIDEEFAQTLDDILKRRSKLGVKTSAKTQDAIKSML